MLSYQSCSFLQCFASHWTHLRYESPHFRFILQVFLYLSHAAYAIFCLLTLYIYEVKGLVVCLHCKWSHHINCFWNMHFYILELANRL